MTWFKKYPFTIGFIFCVAILYGGLRFVTDTSITSFENTKWVLVRYTNQQDSKAQKRIDSLLCLTCMPKPTLAMSKYRMSFFSILFKSILVDFRTFAWGTDRVILLWGNTLVGFEDDPLVPFTEIPISVNACLNLWMIGDENFRSMVLYEGNEMKRVRDTLYVSARNKNICFKFVNVK